ncbi:cysteine-rich motor neuron 1 protein-like, partial [Saccoglossus kowalevskii]|uniref:Cysteine-rich motor neuron 1 protein-like n=1 Tax=Saccoglossus kowalevskii TaxID=10224 RepID=A0ABM0LYW9_SACKO
MFTICKVTLCFSLVVTLGFSAVLGYSYSCTFPCDVESCPPTNCKGGMVDDSCGCCKICAKQVDERCGGLGDDYCDEGLYCSGPAHGDYITGFGTCQYKSDHLVSCENFYTGCNIENSECRCGNNVKACSNPFSYTDKKQCRRTLARMQ